MAKPNIVGDVINFRGFVYGPVNEMGVVALFSKISEDLGFIVEAVRAAYPDCIARRKAKGGWEHVRIEFEFRSSNFKLHGHDPNECELVVCWEHDWLTCPVPVLSLKEYLADPKSTQVSHPPMIRLAVLTNGGIKNGYINIKPLDGFWPSACVGGNTKVATKQLIVELEGVGRLTTDISGRHKTFRSAHGEVKAFVSKHKLKHGDRVEIIRIAPFEYRIRPAK